MRNNKTYSRLGLFLLIFLCLMPLSSFGQRFEWDMDSLSAKYNVERTIPKGFNLLDYKSRYFEITYSWYRDRADSPWRNSMARLGIFYYPLQSDDRQCELLSSIWISEILYDSLKNLGARNICSSILIGIFNGSDDFNFDDNVTIIAGAKPKEWFNADSVYIMDFPMEPISQDGETYTHGTLTFLFRNEGKSLMYGWLFTDEGATRKLFYMEKLRKHAWFIEIEE